MVDSYNFNMVKASKSFLIKNGTCVPANPLCMDVTYSYCFSVNSEVEPNVYGYEIRSESTMPLPVEQ